MEVTNRFKRLDLIDKVPEELWMEDCDIVQKTGIKTAQEKEMQKKQNGCLRNSCEMKRSEKQRKKGKTYPFECRVPKNSKER